ncbi:VOC family protein [Chelatococcus composti]|uniref:Catechol 2,3-dioxygenase-like lactoylglutathione lyase family enzyme n=1 Tax=Chelatococcus composti TaxID=1743235 RepID=A0A841KBN0_9HYPH|nr:VOC family protein [Chelatococcus composti]MBB6166873.1 catechol 2,3-dioxygenase-like lactoylglutathione lyase family enzyme [Chelatococcus composti]MBS7734201.1 VOC family protein [Chelatococcus composti]GGG25177.1 lactoylglutathione lyase [Chelatococcus composti]
MTDAAAPRITAVVETVLYVDDLARARRFYETVFGLEAEVSDRRFTAYPLGPGSVLLLFKRGETLAPVTLPGGTIPPHDGNGPLHVGLGVPSEDMGAWEARLAAHGIPIEGRTEWPRGGRSIYFRDPDGHLVELLTPGVWTVY